MELGVDDDDNDGCIKLIHLLMCIMTWNDTDVTAST
jgi:hypothetical protein